VTHARSVHRHIQGVQTIHASLLEVSVCISVPVSVSLCGNCLAVPQAPNNPSWMHKPACAAADCLVTVD
jgi:hypothetical protein